MARRLPIAQKGILLVAFPLVVEIVLISALFIQLETFEHEISKQKHATAIVSSLNGIRERVESGFKALALFQQTRDEKHLSKYDRLLDEAPAAVAELLDLCKNNKSDLEEALKVEKSLNEALGILKEGKENIVTRNKFASFSTIPTLMGVAFTVEGSLGTLAKRYKGSDKALQEAEQRRADAIKIWLAGGLIINMMVALGSIWFFTNKIASRVQMLTDNTHRLAAGEALNPEMEAGDEIADLDQDFRSMADKLTKAQSELWEMTSKAVASEENIRLVIENMPVGVLVIDDSDHIQSVNPKIEHMFGYSADELIGKALSHLVPPDRIILKDRKTSEVVKPGHAKPEESQCTRRTGEPFYCEVTITKYKGKVGKHFLVILQDVTERHEMERMKQEFVSMVSHDLRTPLNAVQGTLELLLEGTYGELTASGTKRVRVAFESTDRLITLINDLLDIEKMEAGKMQVELKEVRLHDVLSSSVESVRTLAEQAKVRLEYAETDLELVADKDRLIQVLINLLSNAVKFSPAESVVAVKTEVDGGMALVSVIDKGRGIPADQLDSVFQRYSQVKASDGARKKGTGLGLPICKAIIESHNGTIGVTSTEGAGSTFFFKVPLSKNAHLLKLSVNDQAPA